MDKIFTNHANIASGSKIKKTLQYTVFPHIRE